MRLAAVAAVSAAALAALALAVVAPAGAGLPQSGLVVPGKSLGGVRLGDPVNTVLDRWGRSFGICKGCKRPTWYFNYVAFQPQGTGVVLAGTRAAELFTLWSPQGWHTPNGLTVGDPASRITALYGPLDRQDCLGYYRLLLHRHGTTTAFYVVDERVWGFGISRGGSRPCL